jgi:hypothetical protein
MSSVAKALLPARINCTGQMNHNHVTLHFDETSLAVNQTYQAPLTYAFKEKKLVGTGYTARNIYFFDGAEVSFHDTYGCLSQVEFKMADHSFNISNVTCVREPVPPCAKTSNSQK